MNNIHPAITALAAALRGNDYGYSADGDTLTVWREYGQRFLRHATREEPAEYTEETSEYLTVKIEGDSYILRGEDGGIIHSEAVFEEDNTEKDQNYICVDNIVEVIDDRIPFRDLEAEYYEAIADYFAEYAA